MKKIFVFVVDSYANPRLTEGLNALGLKPDEEYYVTGAGGSRIILSDDCGKRFVESERLLVFLSSFRGEVEPAVKLAKEIKSINPNAKIVFRSSTERSSDPVFFTNMKKDPNYEVTLKIVEEFISEK